MERRPWDGKNLNHTETFVNFTGLAERKLRGAARRRNSAMRRRSIFGSADFPAVVAVSSGR
jgi:hypothetical protein